jgi:hypothetical protein
MSGTLKLSPQEAVASRRSVRCGPSLRARQDCIAEAMPDGMPMSDYQFDKLLRRRESPVACSRLLLGSNRLGSRTGRPLA